MLTAPSSRLFVAIWDKINERVRYIHSNECYKDLFLIHPINQNMSDSYRDLPSEPLLANQPPPPPPPQYPDLSNNPNPSFNNPNPSFNNPNPSFNQGYNNQPYNAGNQEFNGGNQGYSNQGYNPGNQGYNGGNQGFNGANQGYNGGNQGYSNNQGFNPGPYIPAPSGNLLCPFCRKDTGSISRKVAGGVTWIWCCVLFFFTGIFCCWVPFCVDSCKDTELVCTLCQATKSRIPANCC